jgi:glutaredoxin
MQHIVWSKDNCPMCVKATKLLDSYGYEYEVRKIGDGWSREQLLESVPEARSVPQVFLYGKHIGGLTELQGYLEDVHVNSTEGRI